MCWVLCCSYYTAMELSILTPDLGPLLSLISRRRPSPAEGTLGGAYGWCAFAVAFQFIHNCEDHALNSFLDQIPTQMAQLVEHRTSNAKVLGLFNPLSPGIKFQILLLCFHTFLTEVVGRSC